MTTITIPKRNTTAEELVAIPRKEYEEFSRWKNSGTVKEFTPTVTQKRALEQSRRAYQRGEYLTLNELKHKLGIKSSR